MNEYLKIARSQIPRYFMDLLELTLGPKKFLVNRPVFYRQFVASEKYCRS